MSSLTAVIKVSKSKKSKKKHVETKGDVRGQTKTLNKEFIDNK
jgi:hypothetical protein